MTAQLIPTPETLLNQLQALPPEQRQQVVDFMEFLTQKYAHLPTPDHLTSSPRVLGLQAGQGWISPDFNDPLPDEFWLGET
jgi:hypothetical protein